MSILILLWLIQFVIEFITFKLFKPNPYALIHQYQNFYPTDRINEPLSPVKTINSIKGN